MRACIGLIGLALCWLAPAAAFAQVSATFEAASDKSFDRPHDLVLSADKKRLYVADLGNDAVKVLDPETLATLGSIGKDDLDSPHDVAFDAAGRLMVADTGNDRIAIYAVAGVTGTLVEEIKGLSGPEGVAEGAPGRIYLTNVGTHDVRLVQGGKTRGKIGGYGSATEQYVRPHDIDVGPDGRVYVSDPGNNRIQVLDAELTLLGVIGGSDYDFHEPKYFAVDEAGWLFVGDEYNHQIKILDGDRRVVAVIGTGERGEGPNRFNQPEGVEVWENRLWIADTQNGRIVRYRLEGLPKR